MKENKLVHCHIFQPHKSMFKRSKNERAQVQTISCCNYDNCDLLNRKECSLTAFFGGACPYGIYTTCSGFTKRAAKYYEWIGEQKNKYSGIAYLNHPTTMMANVGGYIFLPYSHMNMLKQLEWKAQFLKKEDFSVENIIKLIHFKPYAIFGGEIKRYQKEVPPVFLKHLSEQMPDLFEKVISTDKYAKERFQEHTNIGRKAILETTTPNVGMFKDIHGASWEWDGERLKSYNSHASFMLVNKYKELIVVPEKGEKIIITHEGQVNEKTVFIG